MKEIDLRSDTVTWPTDSMRQAMGNARVGDDGYGEDPTVNQLEALAATMVGMEAALFVPSGTMGNLAALLAYCQQGDEVILGDRSHIYLLEQGGMAAIGGITPCPLPNREDGTLALDAIAGAVRPEGFHFAHTRLVCLENTQNMCNGMPVSADYTGRVADLAHSCGLRVHMDGARIFNAAAALDTDVCSLVSDVDSVMFCLSKGLCAPVGSVLCGETDFISRARRARALVGGAMRQAGVLASAGIVALEQMVDRLSEDHIRAEKLAEGLASLPGIEVAPVNTNIVYFTLSERALKTAEDVKSSLAQRGILVQYRADGRFRAVTHYWIDDQDVDTVLAAMQQVMS